MSIRSKNYYKILNVAYDATQTEIKLQYRSLAKKYHPDVSSQNEDSHIKISEINSAYETLKKAKDRYKYNVEVAESSYRVKNFKEAVLVAEKTIEVFPKEVGVRRLFYNILTSWIRHELIQNNFKSSKKILKKALSSGVLTIKEKESLNNILFSDAKNEIKSTETKRTSTTYIKTSSKKEKIIYYALIALRNQLGFGLYLINFTFNLLKNIVFHILNMLLGMVDAVGIATITNIFSILERGFYYVFVRVLNFIEDIVSLVVNKIIYYVDKKRIKLIKQLLLI